MLDRRDNVAGEHFGQVVKQAAKKVIVGAGRAGLDREAEKVGQTGHNEHVSQHRGGGNARGLRPADLKAQLPAEVGQPCQGRAGRAHSGKAGQVGKGRQPVVEGLADVVHFFVKGRVEWFNKAKFPL